MSCFARLNYNSGSVAAVLKQVGVDDGSTNPSNLGKYCSNPALVGGIAGVPGAGENSERIITR